MTTRYVVVISNNEGGVPAFLCNSLEEARQAIRDYLSDPDIEPRPTPAEVKRIERDLVNLTGRYVEHVWLCDAVKEDATISQVRE